jgi:hypothetical protein
MEASGKALRESLAQLKQLDVSPASMPGIGAGRVTVEREQTSGPGSRVGSQSDQATL